jgi:hypothetical protein
MKPERRGTITVVAVLVVLTIAKGLLWMAAFPPWKICDEPSHFDNIQFRAEHGRAPVDEGGDIPKVMHDGASPELKLSWTATGKYKNARYLPNTRTVPEERLLADLARTTENRITDGQASAVNYPGLYYWAASFPYRMFRQSSILQRVMAIRSFSLFLGVITVVFTYFAALLALKHRAMAFAAAFIVVMQPMESQMTVAINNDVAVIGFAAVIYFLQLLTVQSERPSPLVGLALGSSLSAIILSKPHGYAMIPGSAFVVALTLWRHPRSRQAWLFTAFSILPFVAFGGIHIYHLYSSGILIPAQSHPTKPDPGFLVFLNTLGDDYTAWLFRSAWGQFGWLDFALDGEWFDLVHAVWFAATCGLIVASVRWVVRSDDRMRLWFSGRLVIFSAATAAVVIVFILFAEYRFRLVGVLHVIQGRSFLFALPAVAIVVCAGIGSLVPARFRQLSAAGLCTAAFALHLGALICIVRYHSVD